MTSPVTAAVRVMWTCNEHLGLVECFPSCCCFVVFLDHPASGHPGTDHVCAASKSIQV